MSEHKEEKGFIDNLKPQAAFKVGLLSGLGIMFVLGFFIMLGMLLNGDGISLGSGSKKANDNNKFEAPKQAVVNQDTGIEFVQPHSEDYVKGNPDAKVTLVEYSDIDCPFCQRFHGTIGQILEAYPNDVNVVFRHFPLTQLHPDAATKAAASECVGELGGNDAFWSYLDVLFNNKTAVSGLAQAAGQVGVDQTAFQECLDSGKYDAKIAASTQEATKAGARGTPYSILTDGTQTIPVNGALPFEQVKPQIDSLLSQ